MQYVLIEIQHQFILVDTNEMHAIESYGHDGISDSPKPDEQTTPLLLCYGAYMPRHGVSDERALVDLLSAKGNWMGCITGPISQLIAVQDIRAFGMVKISRQTRIPFAALIQVHEAVIDKIKDDDTQAITAFIRYSNMSPADNVLNRQGVFALQEVERRVKDGLTLDGWDKFIDRTRVQRTPRRIK